MKVHRFVHEDSGWYIDLPVYIAQGGSKGDLQMIDGADTLLDMIAGEETEVSLQIDRHHFPGADQLTLTGLCDPLIGGGNYHLKTFEGKKVAKDLWLCDVTRFVFGDIPEKIFVKRNR